METKDTTMTIFIDDMLKKKAKVNALMSNMTLKEYIAYLIKEDCNKNPIIKRGSKIIRRLNKWKIV